MPATRHVLLVLALTATTGCRQPDAARSEPRLDTDAPPSASSATRPLASTTQPAASGGAYDPGCTSHPSAWCSSPAGDPCGEHHDVTSCRADKRCKGMRYTGESLVACEDDGTGFTSNCPTVGCISR